MKIKNASGEDVKDVVDISYNSGYSKLSKMRLRELFSKELKRKGHKFFIIKDKNNPIGYIALQEGKRKKEITYIEIKKKYQNKGIGSKLIKYIERYAKNKRYKEIGLEVWNKNFNALRFYNYHKFYTVKTYKGKNKLKLIMQKEI